MQGELPPELQRAQVQCQAARVLNPWAGPSRALQPTSLCCLGMLSPMAAALVACGASAAAWCAAAELGISCSMGRGHGCAGRCRLTAQRPYEQGSTALPMHILTDSRMHARGLPSGGMPASQPSTIPHLQIKVKLVGSASLLLLHEGVQAASPRCRRLRVQARGIAGRRPRQLHRRTLQLRRRTLQLRRLPRSGRGRGSLRPEPAVLRLGCAW